MTPEQFIKIWKDNPLSERGGAQGYCDDLCEVLGVDKPRKAGEYQYEYGAAKASGGNGWADVWKRGYFGWENKKPNRDLKAALKQLTDYALALENPPLLIVCDRERIEIHTAFTGYPDQVRTILLADIGKLENLQVLRWVFTDPLKLRPIKSSSAITEEAAGKFAEIADSMRNRGIPPQQVAHFLMQCIFCMFAEDEGLLPTAIFSNLLNKTTSDVARAKNRLSELFKAMRKGGNYGDDLIGYFNGGLFKEISIPELTQTELQSLASTASEMDWRAIEPAIFGTLFERGLNPKKRSQLGAHYTDTHTIMRIIEPVIKEPLLVAWEEIKPIITAAIQKSKKEKDKFHKEAYRLFQTFLEQLRNFRVLDPACGSGNFLYLALKTLKDIEKQVNIDAEQLGLQRQVSIEVSPSNVLGIEIDPYAAELARITVWIGELQWMLQNGYEYNKNPILKSLDNIETRDALINTDGHEADWPPIDTIVGNPPFLGDKKMRGELGAIYTEQLRKTYADNVPGAADLVCYWFHKSNQQIISGKAKSAGLVSTNSIRGGANRKVLDAITSKLSIFNAWSDEEWINEGAAVRTSLVAFSEAALTKEVRLNGKTVEKINSDLTAGYSDASTDVDLTKIKKIKCNRSTSFQGAVTVGKFDIPAEAALQWLTSSNPHCRPNAQVLRPLFNTKDITSRERGFWLVDFFKLSEEEASMFEKPFEHVLANVKPKRVTNARPVRAKFWWRHGETGDGLRNATAKIDRVIVTPRVSKHRIFVWKSVHAFCDDATVTIARSDDTTFGILHSRFHELWSLGVCTWMGKGNHPRYTPTTCFDTFPFPEGLSPADTTGETENNGEYRLPCVKPECKSHAQAIALAAHKLNELRNNWLNPKELVDWMRTPEEEAANFPQRPVAKAGKEKELKKRTLTNLYNAQPAWLNMQHRVLDRAVALAYGWDDYSPEITDDEILSRLLALNLERSAN